MTSDQWSPLSTSFGYSSTTGLLNSVTRGTSPTIGYTIAPAASLNLTSTSTSAPYATVTDGNNHTTDYLLDLRGRLLSQVNPAGDAQQFQLDAAGNVTLSVDGLGRPTYNSYDSSGDLTQTVLADGSFTQFQYDPKFHEVTQTTDSLGQVTSDAYNQTSGLEISSTDALGEYDHLRLVERPAAEPDRSARSDHDLSL